MQARIVDLLAQVSIDDITGDSLFIRLIDIDIPWILVDLLRYNDEFNNAFKTYESYMEERDRRFGASHMPRMNQPASSSVKKVRSIFFEYEQFELIDRMEFSHSHRQQQQRIMQIMNHY